MAEIGHYTTTKIKLSDLKAIARGRGLKFIHSRNVRYPEYPDFIRRLEYFLPTGRPLLLIRWPPYADALYLSSTWNRLRNKSEPAGCVVVDFLDVSKETRLEEMRDILVSWSSLLPCSLVVLNRYTL